MTLRNNLDLFKKEFKEEVINMSNVNRIEFFGSILTPNWKIGESDVDVIVYGNNIPAKIKIKIILTLRDLNQKYGLQLESVKCCHPTPFFLDSPQRTNAFRTTMSGHSNIVELGRQFLKQNAPTYGEIWVMEDSVKIIENLLTPLPIPIPKVSEIFDKFR